MIDKAFSGISVVGGLIRQKTVQPGESYEGIILIKNNDDKVAEVKVYKRDYLFYCDGRNVYGDPGSVERSNSQWISLSPSFLTIPPKETGQVYYTVSVPKNPDLKGTYWSLIMIEPVLISSEESIIEEKGKTKIGIKAIIRYAIQIVTNIGETGERKIRFLDKKLVDKDNKKILQLDIENIGERKLSPFVWAEVYNKDGINIGRFDSESGKLGIYPGCSVRHNINLSGIPEGKYEVLIVVDNGDEYVFGAQYKIDIK